jgi:pimeloyl-ACP methyl ester carboxylesterase
MDHVGIGAAIQLGFSFGGMIAQDFARRRPQRTLALIAYGCVPIFLTPTPMRPLLWAAMRLQLSLQPWSRFVETFVQQASHDQSLQRELAASMSVQSPTLRDAIWEAMLFGASNEPDFQFSCPAGHIMGERDDRFPGAHAAMKAFVGRMPKGHAVEIPSAGHMAHRETPEAFNQALLALIERLKS